MNPNSRRIETKAVAKVVRTDVIHHIGRNLEEVPDGHEAVEVTVRIIGKSVHECDTIDLYRRADGELRAAVEQLRLDGVVGHFDSMGE